MEECYITLKWMGVCFHLMSTLKFFRMISPAGVHDLQVDLLQTSEKPLLFSSDSCSVPAERAGSCSVTEHAGTWAHNSCKASWEPQEGQ